ncbi:MAG: hypothetical protein NC180_07015 [Muribaculaceae bacterium]|nr:hypothetical protein [Roseburia sp.]MCM1430019.1 hypothetical protein [Muribaculaceae bacterium]MCM1492954.1 hypothetical protein [Muribaculaceae bacterium]
MIVAAYRNENALWATVLPIAPVTPVGRYEKYSRQQRDSNHSQQDKNSFAKLLVSIQNSQDGMDVKGFDFHA